MAIKIEAGFGLSEDVADREAGVHFSSVKKDGAIPQGCPSKDTLIHKSQCGFLANSSICLKICDRARDLIDD